MAALSARNHPTECTVVLPLLPQLPRLRGDDAGTGGGGGPLDDQPLGLEGSVLDLWKRLNCPIKLIAVDEQSNDNVMQPGRFRKTNRFAR